MALQELVLDHVFGYRGFDCRNNLHYLNDGADIVFHTAAAVIIQNLSAGQLTLLSTFHFYFGTQLFLDTEISALLCSPCWQEPRASTWNTLTTSSA